jgi:Mce-associated membrane protein
VVAVLGTLVTWLGFRAYQLNQTQHEHALFVEVARKGALNLTTISYTEVDADVQRILDMATGQFYDDFAKRSQPFVAVVKQVESTSKGTVTGVGLESQDGRSARVLVAVSVNTTTVAATEPRSAAWRLRITVDKVGGDAKVSNVEFVP